MTEVELAAIFIAHFGDKEIYKEVPAGGIRDIVVLDGTRRICLEVKTSLNYDVIWQARSAAKYFHYSYVAVPAKSRPHTTAEEICKAWGIGIIGYNPVLNTVIEYVKPRLNRKVMNVTLHEYMKRSVAGSQNQRITSFGYFVERLEDLVKRKPGIEAKQLFEELEYRHYKTFTPFKNNVLAYIRNNVIKNIECREGKFYIKPQDK